MSNLVDQTLSGDGTRPSTTTTGRQPYEHDRVVVPLVRGCAMGLA
jgi:hypothetical protein